MLVHIHPWCAELTSVIIIMVLQSTFSELSAPFSDMLHTHYTMPHTHLLTGGKLKWWRNVLPIKISHTKTFSVGLRFPRCCHCTSNYPMNSIWLLQTRNFAWTCLVLSNLSCMSDKRNVPHRMDLLGVCKWQWNKHLSPDKSSVAVTFQQKKMHNSETSEKSLKQNYHIVT